MRFGRGAHSGPGRFSTMGTVASIASWLLAAGVLGRDVRSALMTMPYSSSMALFIVAGLWAALGLGGIILMAKGGAWRWPVFLLALTIAAFFVGTVTAHPLRPLLTDSQKADLSTLLNYKCPPRTCNRPLVELVIRPNPDSILRAKDLYEIFDDVFWPGDKIRSNIWWTKRFLGPGVNFIFPANDVLAEEFSKKLHDIQPNIGLFPQSEDPTWRFWIESDQER